LVLTVALGAIALLPTTGQAQSVARQWDEALLSAIRIDFPAPTVHSRNLYHTSAAMYDAWAAFDAISDGVYYTPKHTATNLSAARNEAISYAAYRVLSERYTHSVNPTASQAIFDNLMDSLGYNRNITTTVGNSPAAIGNRIAAQLLAQTINDGSNEANGYVDNTGYVPLNSPMTVDYPSVTGKDGGPLVDPNRWQPLFIHSAVTQNGLEGENLQQFVSPHWGSVTTFAMDHNGTSGPFSWSGIDPGMPPQLNSAGDAEYRSDTMLLIKYSNALDPNQGPGSELINISPNTSGNRPLGTHNDQGYASNPVTGVPYADNFVKRADYGRVLAEFWADGPESETPPGHWNVIANLVADDARLQKRIGGQGATVDDLQWDVKMYLALNGAVHDAAIAAWGAKAVYDYVRPVTKIRYQGGLGQSSNPALPSYHPDGLPLEAEVVELITAESIAPGGRHRNAYINANVDADGNFIQNYTEAEMVGKIAIHAWDHEPEDPATQVSGTAWILAENWVPYQADNFVTPAFAAYVSGHSTFSRSAAEVMAAMTGSPYFPGGLGELTFDASFLDFEMGPSQPVTLQWASYFDAADEAGISRLWGGIHVPADDFAGRIMGSHIGQDAFDYAQDLFVSDNLTWRNRVQASDVNHDGTIAPLDALLVINEFSFHEFSDPLTGELAQFELIPPAFVDVNGDGFVAPLDALLVINQLPTSASSAPLPHTVPEPAAGLLALGGLSLGWLRRRRIAK
jgi:uncharacterized protein (TIGR03382 family)